MKSEEFLWNTVEGPFMDMWFMMLISDHNPNAIDKHSNIDIRLKCH